MKVCMVEAEGKKEVLPLYSLSNMSQTFSLINTLPKVWYLPTVPLPLPKQVTTVVISLLNSPVVIENSCYPKGPPLPPCLEF